MVSTSLDSKVSSYNKEKIVTRKSSAQKNFLVLWMAELSRFQFFNCYVTTTFSHSAWKELFKITFSNTRTNTIIWKEIWVQQYVDNVQKKEQPRCLHGGVGPTHRNTKAQMGSGQKRKSSTPRLIGCQ